MSQTKMFQKPLKLAETAQENPDHRFTNLYSLLHWDYWIDRAARAVLPRPESSTASIDGTTRDNFKKNYESETQKTRGKSEGQNLYAPTSKTNLYPEEQRQNVASGDTCPQRPHCSRSPQSNPGSNL